MRVGYVMWGGGYGDMREWNGAHGGQQPTAVSPGFSGYWKSKLTPGDIMGEGEPLSRMAAVHAVAQPDGQT